MKVAYIKWLDARGLGGDRPLSVLAKANALIMESAGLLVNEDKEVIRLTQDIYSYTQDGETTTTVRDGEIIPQKYIISKRIIDIEELSAIDRKLKDLRPVIREIKRNYPPLKGKP